MSGMRMTGLVSGLDTETIISQLISGHKAKVETAQGEQKRLEWKKDAWASLNTKIANFYNGALSKLRMVSTYKAKKVDSTSSKITVNASNSAVNGSHTVSVKQVASAAYLTGTDLRGKSYKTTSYKAASDANVQVSDLVDSKGYKIDLEGKSFDISYTNAEGETVTKTITAKVGEDGTLQSMIDNMNQDLQDAGIDMEVSYNSAKGGLEFVNHTAQAVKDEEGTVTGYEGGIDYTLKANDAASAKALGISEKGVVVSQQKTDLGENILTMGNAFNVASVSETEAAVTGSTKLTDMGIADGTIFTLKVGGKEYNYTIDQTTTLSGLASQFSKMGVNASYDAKQGRFFISSTESGEDYDFKLTASDDSALDTLGLGSAATKIDAKDAIVVYNGAEFKQSSNEFSLNGLNFTVNDVTVDENGKDEPIKLTVSDDVDAVYDAVKDFITEYNSLLKEMSSLYYAESAKDYQMLTDAQKDAMSEDDVKEWEDKIKAALLRRDSGIESFMSTMRTAMNKSVNYTNADGATKRYSLASFGIVTGNWNEYGLLHIEGDADEGSYADMTNKLKAAISDNPGALIETLTTLTKDLYSSFQKTYIKSSDYKSTLSFYEDKKIDNDITSYKDKIKKLQEKMNKAEDKYYKQFARMETAMAKIQASSTSFSGFFGS